MRRVLVLGLPRGGTTWVGRALGHTRGAVYVHEPDGVHEPFAFRARMHDRIKHFAILPPDRNAPEYARVWEGAFAGGRPAGTVRDRASRAAFKRVSAEERRDVRAGGKPSLRLRFATAAAVPFGPRSDAESVVVKSVNAALGADWIYERFQPAVLVVQRDLRNVLASWIAMGFGPPSPRVVATLCDEARRRWQVDIAASDDKTVRTTVLCAVSMLALHDCLRRYPEWHVLSHEAACADPLASLTNIAVELDLEWSSDADEFVLASDRPGTGYATNRVAAELPDQWQHRLTPEQVDRVEGVLAQIPAELWDTART